MYGQFCPNQNFLDTKITKVSSMVLRCKKYGMQLGNHVIYYSHLQTRLAKALRILACIVCAFQIQAARGIHVCLPRVLWFRGCLRQRVCLYKELFLARLEKSFCTYLLCSIMAIATFSLSLDMARSSTFWLYLFNRISCSFTDSRYDTRDAWPVVAAKFRAVFWMEKKKLKYQ